MFCRVVIQKNLRKVYTVKSAFAKVAHNRSTIFNYTLDQDFLIINLSFSLNNILVFFSSSHNWNEGDVVWILLQTGITKSCNHPQPPTVSHDQPKFCNHHPRPTTTSHNLVPPRPSTTSHNFAATIHDLPLFHHRHPGLKTLLKNELFQSYFSTTLHRLIENTFWFGNQSIDFFGSSKWEVSLVWAVLKVLRKREIVFKINNLKF